MTKDQAQKAIDQISVKIGKLEDKETMTDWDEELMDLLNNAETELQAIIDHYEAK